MSACPGRDLPALSPAPLGQKVKVEIAQSCPTLCDPGNSPGQNTGVGSLSLLQGIFPTQISNPGLPHCRRILYQLSHKGSLSQKRGTTVQQLGIALRGGPRRPLHQLSAGSTGLCYITSWGWFNLRTDTWLRSSCLPKAGEGNPTKWACPLCSPHRARPSEGVDVSLVVVAEADETSRGISSFSLHSLLSVPVVFLINTFEIFMKATSMKQHNITLK